MKDSDMEPELAAEPDQERLGDAEVTGGEGESPEAVEGLEATGGGGGAWRGHGKKRSGDDLDGSSKKK
jgi:hypothetical protein